MSRRASAQPAFDVARRMAGYASTRERSAKRQLQQAARRWKGKERAAPRADWADEWRVRRDEGSGGSDGVVLDLSMSGDGIWESVYTVPVQVGANNQSFDLQVDMGSSDLWIAADSCSSSACKKAKSYDPSSSSSASQSSKDFSIQYLSGAVSGPIYWDTFTLGGYQITNQALAAATSVQNETLSSDYSGILGLALTADSVIASEIPPVEDSSPDGQTMASNLFSSTPADTAPSQFFISLLLDRPGSARVPALLGIGRHPSDDELSDGMSLNASAVAYSTPTAERNGIHWWKSELREITVYVNGTANKIALGNGVSGSAFPEAVLDTGVPYIISTPSIANAVWGALGISPSSDGNYYLPCTTPLNITVTLDDRTEIPLHPLDLTAEPSGNSGSSQCVGMFMQSSVLANPSGFGDIILGVPFLRNVYTVMAYQSVSSDGTVSGNSSSESNPYLGLLNITNATLAMEEFNQVRVENKPLDGSVGTTSKASSGLSGGSKAGIIVGGIFGFCALILGLRFLYTFQRQRNKKKDAKSSSADETTDKEAYAMAAFHRDVGPFRTHSYVPSEDTQATLTDPFARLDKKYDSFHINMASLDEEEFGVLRKSKASESDESDGERDHGILQEGNRESTLSWVDAYAENTPPLMGEWRPPTTPTTHERSFSASSALSAHNLLGRPASRTWRSDPAPDEFGGLPTRRSLANPDAATRRSRPEDLTLVGNGPEPGSGGALASPSPRVHARKISRSSDSSSSVEGDETTALTAPPASITYPPPAESPSPTSTSFSRPSRRVSGPRPLSGLSRVVNADGSDRRSSTYSR